MTFEQMNLGSDITKAILNCGYTTPTPIQARCIPDILEGKDVVASAQTGTGKTAAFVLPALHRLSTERTSQKPRILILTPTRELASQITTAATNYGKFLRFNMASLVGGMPYRQQLRDLSRAVDIVVATPGRLLDHVENGRLDLSGIEMLILDEADRMLDMGFIDDVQMIAKATPNTRQTLLFSATVDDKLAHVVRHLLKNPVRIDLSHDKGTPTLIKQEIYMADNFQHKTRLLQHFLENGNIYKAIIFSATKINADKLANDLRDMGFPAAALHGDLKQNVRNRTIEQLRKGKIQFLVATDVAARGIDIADITHVINYDLPRFCEDYVHRIGRTGRAGKTGIAISFALPMDARHLQRIERFTGQKITKEVIPGLEPTKKAMTSMMEPGNNKKKFGKSGMGRSFSRDDAPPRRKSFSGGEESGRSFSGARKEGAKSFASRDRGDFSRSGTKSFSGGRKEGGKSFSSDRDGAPRSFSGGRDGAARSGSRDGAPRSFSGGRDGAPRSSGSRDGARSFSGGRDGAPRSSGSRDGARSFSGGRDGAPRSSDSRDGARSFSGGRDAAPRSFSGDRDGAPRSFSGGRDAAPRSFSGGRDAAPRSFSGGRDGAPRSFSGDRDAAPRSFSGGRDGAPRSFSSDRDGAPRSSAGARDGAKSFSGGRRDRDDSSKSFAGGRRDRDSSKSFSSSRDGASAKPFSAARKERDGASAGRGGSFRDGGKSFSGARKEGGGGKTFGGPRKPAGAAGAKSFDGAKSFSDKPKKKKFADE